MSSSPMKVDYWISSLNLKVLIDSSVHQHSQIMLFKYLTLLSLAQIYFQSSQFCFIQQLFNMWNNIFLVIIISFIQAVESYFCRKHLPRLCARSAILLQRTACVQCSASGKSVSPTVPQQPKSWAEDCQAKCTFLKIAKGALVVGHSPKWRSTC